MTSPGEVKAEKEMKMEVLMGDKRKLMKASETMAVSKFRTRDFQTENIRKSEEEVQDDSEDEHPNTPNLIKNLKSGVCKGKWRDILGEYLLACETSFWHCYHVNLFLIFSLLSNESSYLTDLGKLHIRNFFLQLRKNMSVSHM